MTAASAIGAALLIWVWRRPEQLLRPYVWDEESHVLGSWLVDGWAAAMEPVQGYYILPASFLIVLAAEISVVHLPVVMYAFSCLLFLVTVTALVLPASRWGDVRVRSAMALAAALVPVNPEVFGVLLYGFWWATLWPVIILGWQRPLWLLRIPMLALAALSSPAAGSLVVVWIVAAAWRRRRVEYVSVAVLAAGFALQMVVYLSSTRSDAATDWVAVGHQVLRSAGLFETWWLMQPASSRSFVVFVGVLFLGWLGGSAFWRLRREGDPSALLLYLAGLLCAGASAVPAPLLTDPVFAGPRYFFLPFVLWSWTLVHLVAHQARDWSRGRAVAGALLLSAALGLTTTFSRQPATTTAHLDWENQLRKCAASTQSTYSLPIYFDGGIDSYWPLSVSPEQCRGILE